MMNGISGTQPSYVPAVHHAEAKITFLAHVEEMLPESSHSQENAAPDCMGGTDKCGSYIDVTVFWCSLAHGLVLSDVDEWNRDGSDARVTELGQSLFHRAG
jgi:hypothetical protein